MIWNLAAEYKSVELIDILSLTSRVLGLSGPQLNIKTLFEGALFTPGCRWIVKIWLWYIKQTV
jgi:hypothetical protein